MNIEELNKIIAVKKMDLEECEQELHNRYYPSVVRIAMTNYISALQEQLENYNNHLKQLKFEPNTSTQTP
jgi:Coiled-coil domain-containing protein 167